jgi:protein phosphatase
VQVGDSRAYLLRDQSFQQVARDHSWVTEQVAAGALTADQAKTHPRRNVLTRAVGTGPAVEADLGVVELREGDHLLLCSDGLHGLVSDEEMAKVIAEQEPQQACQTLVDRANEGGVTTIARWSSLGSRASRPLRTWSAPTDSRRRLSLSARP